MQSKLLYLAVISVLLFLITLEKWFLAVSILFIFIPVLTNIFEFFAYKQADLTITRKVVHISDADNIVSVTLEVINNGKKSAWVEIEDLIDVTLLDENESNKWLFTFKQNEKKELQYNIKTKRGIRHFNGVKVTSSDWFGFKKLSHTLDVKSTLQVNPSLDIKDKIAIKSKLLHGFSGLINSKRAGAGVDFFSLRQYNNQDSLKHIHWRASAKLQEGFLVKENQVTKNSTIIIDVDTRSHLLPHDEHFQLLEYSLKATRLIAEVLIDDGHKVGLSAEQNENYVILPAQCSIHQKFKINQKLANITEYQGSGPRSLVNMQEKFLKHFSSIFIISPLDKNDIKYLINLKRRGYKVVCISPDYTGLSLASQQNSEHLKLKRKLFIQGLFHKGITVINWDITQPFSHCIHQINVFTRMNHES
ncbi:MAG: DUF58 domain-containing protein [Saccharospirillaceae bacterium]|nr:DUF58 domain-containing protein [Pseudomonadales bacterium]NRB79973.1 DUF58 domain-containing protein [Saccharospirillaceae bacterium]